MRTAVIDGQGLVANVIEAEEGYALEGFTLIPSDVAGPGWTYTDGMFAAPPAPPPQVPAEVTNFQGHAALIMAGLDDQAQAAISAMPDATEKRLAQLAFDKGAFVRTSPMIVTLAAALSLTSDQVDDLFRQAAGIAV